MFSCEFWKHFKNTFFIEHLRWLLLLLDVLVQLQQHQFNKKKLIKIKFMKLNGIVDTSWSIIWETLH